MERKLKQKIAEIIADASPELGLLIKEEVDRVKEENSVLAGVVYTLSEEDALKACKKMIRGRFKRTFQAVLAALLTLAFFISYWRDPAYLQGLILGFVCLALLAVILIVPARVQKQEAKNQSGRERFLLAGNRSMFSSDGESCFQLNYKNDMVKIREDDEFYYLCASRDRNWCVPKKELSREGLTELDEVFRGEDSPFEKDGRK